MDNMSGLGIATLVVALLVFGLFYLKRVFRRHLFPEDREDAGRQAMAELLLLQAELQKRASEEAETEPGGDTPAPPEG